MSNDHIVYAAFDSKGNCLYVGEGKPDRYKHITSELVMYMKRINGTSLISRLLLKFYMKG